MVGGGCVVGGLVRPPGLFWLMGLSVGWVGSQLDEWMGGRSVVADEALLGCLVGCVGLLVSRLGAC